MSKVREVHVYPVDKASESVWVRKDGGAGVAVVLRNDLMGAAVAAIFYPGERARLVAATSLPDLFYPVETGTEVAITVEG